MLLFCCLLVITAGYAQSLTEKDFKHLLVAKDVTLNKTVTVKFKTLYSGPKKEGGLLSCLYNRNADEFLFIDQENDSTLQAITYYIPGYEAYNKLYLSLKADGISVSKLGRTLYEDNGKKYYQLVIQCKPG